MAVLPTLANAPLEISTTATPEEIKRRARIAEALLLQGTSGEPVKHWTQGLNRVAQGLVGGYQLGELRREAEKEQADEAASVLRLPGMRRPPAIEYGATTPQQAIPPSPATVPAPIRFNNPGGQYPGPSATAQGSTGYATIGGGHKIAAFDTPEAGAAAQFDLLNRGYTGRTVADAVAKWSGGNNAPAYVASVERAGIPRDTVITPEFLRSPQGIQLAQAMAQHETGRPYPMTLEQWQSAQGRAFANQPTRVPRVSGQEGGGPPVGLGPQRQPVDLAPDVAASIEDLVRRGKGKEARAMYEKFAKPREELRDLVTPQERAAANVSADYKGPVQRKPTGELLYPEKPFANVNISQQQESEFAKEAGKLQAKRFNDLVDDAPAAKQMLSDVDTLRTLGTQIGTGKEAQIKAALGPYAEALGVKVDKLGEIQAYEAIVNRMAPQLRVKGTGAQSDFELRNFMKSIPSVGNTPQGNELVARTMEGLYNNKINAAEIGSKAMTGEITRNQAEKMLRELPDPMKEWRDFIKANPPAKAGGGPVDYRDYFGKQ